MNAINESTFTIGLKIGNFYIGVFLFERFKVRIKGLVPVNISSRTPNKLRLGPLMINIFIRKQFSSESYSNSRRKSKTTK